MGNVKYLIIGLLVLGSVLYGCGAGSSSVAAVVAAVVQVLVPDSGQTTCYDVAGGTIACPVPDAALAQDGSYSINTPNYTDNTDGTITDNVTSLIWQKCSVGFTDFACTTGAAVTYNWFEATGTADGTFNPGGATDVCGSLTLGGSSSWRMPDEVELQGIVDYEISNPAINATYFPATISTLYWSVTTYAPGSTFAWYVHFGTGSATADPKSSNSYVRCVR